jgi:hypothetical protein
MECAMTANNERPQKLIYLILLATQILGTMILIWHELPAFRRVLLNPGEQPSNDTYSELATFGVSFVMQISYWYRLLYVAIPFRRSNIFLNHLFLFLGRLSFIFGSALFSVVVFRHLPELGRETDIFLMGQRGMVFMASLFALFCASLEVERLGQSFGSDGGK